MHPPHPVWKPNFSSLSIYRLLHKRAQRSAWFGSCRGPDGISSLGRGGSEKVCCSSSSSPPPHTPPETLSGYKYCRSGFSVTVQVEIPKPRRTACKFKQAAERSTQARVQEGDRKVLGFFITVQRRVSCVHRHRIVLKRSWSHQEHHHCSSWG